MIYFKRNSDKQAGFAIGLILLAVVLIAAIVAAIAVSTQDSGNSADREKGRIQASNVIQQAIALSNATSRYDALGLNIGGTGVISGPSAPGSGAGLDLLKAENLMRTLPEPSLQAVTQATSWDVITIQIASAAGAPVIATDPVGTVIYLDNVRQNICDQINSILWQTRPSDTLPTGGVGSAMVDGDLPVTINGRDRTEGCVSAGGSYTYFKQVL